MNNVILVGRLVRDPEMRYFGDMGKGVTRFTIAVEREYSKSQRNEMENQGKQTADFINIVAWGKLAEFCTNHIAKGNRVAVQGRVTTGSYKGKHGQTVYTTDITATTVNPIDWKSNKDGNRNNNNYNRNNNRGNRNNNYNNNQNNQNNQTNFYGNFTDDDIPF